MTAGALLIRRRANNIRVFATVPPGSGYTRSKNTNVTRLCLTTVNEKILGYSALQTALARRPTRTIGLVQGGWIGEPSRSHDLVLLDRNIVSTLRKIISRSPLSDEDRRTREALNRDVAVSPLAHAFEGSSRRRPGLKDLRQDYAAACDVIGKALPAARVVELSRRRSAALSRFYALESAAESSPTDLLLALAPNLACPVRAHDRKRQLQLERLILEKVADENGRYSMDLEALALLSCIYDGGSTGPSPARGVLKPNPNYTASDAHNARADLSTLRALLVEDTLYFNDRLVVFTRDAALARFWVGLGHRLTTTTQQGFPHPLYAEPLRLTRHLFPALSPANRKLLATRIERAMACEFDEDFYP